MEKRVIDGALRRRPTLRSAAELLNVSYSTLRHWIKKHDIKHSRRLKKHECETCGETKEAEFYGKQKATCKRCANANSVEKWKILKLRAIEYKGGCCLACEYSKFYGALEFHHRDPTEKDHNWNTLRLCTWNTIERELNRCDLLCSNCHREEHHRLRIP